MAERQSARMSEIKNAGYTWMAVCNQLTSVAFKSLNISRTCLSTNDFKQNRLYSTRLTSLSCNEIVSIQLRNQTKRAK